MVIKPADQTPLSALFYDHLAKKAGVPDEMLNVVTGYGTTSGAAISSHMDIDQVNFTGSTEVGRLIMQAASLSNLKKVSLQLGGKSPIIIFNDADVDKAAKLAFLGAVVNKGEICGLAAGIVTNNLNTANTVSRSMRPGVILINCYFDFDRYCPFGGYKMSQYGKDWCMDALYKYSAI